MECFGTYFTHVQTSNVTRVQSATQWTASVHTLHMSHVQKALLWTWQPAHMEHIKYTAVRLLKTCTWQTAHMEHTIYTAVRTKVYIQQNHSACTDEALGRVYRWGPWPRVQTRPLPLRPWPEPSACTCDPGPEPSACTCDPRKRVHSRPPDLSVGTLYLQCILPGSCWHPLLCYPISLLPREGQCSTWWGLSQQKGHPESISFVTLKLWLVSDPVFPESQGSCLAKRVWTFLSKRMPSQVLVQPGGLPRPALTAFVGNLQLKCLFDSPNSGTRNHTTIMSCVREQDPLWSTDQPELRHLLSELV